jgi:hypothetical protein
MAGGVAGIVTDNRKKIQSASSSALAYGAERSVEARMAGMAAERYGGKLAAIDVAKVAGKAAGAIVEPAVWVISGERPDEVDVGLWLTGLAGGALGVAAVATGLLKAFVDDDVEKRLALARAAEPPDQRAMIRWCGAYSCLAGQHINAMSIAAAGGTAWEAASGIWVYMVDARGLLVPDYQPRVARRVYQPLLPLQRAADGFRWHSIRGGA